MLNILNYTRAGLSSWFEQRGLRAFRAGQVFRWLYLRQADQFAQMTDISKAVQKDLDQHFYIPRLEIEERAVSRDATEKFLFRLEDGQHIESVLIPEKDHFTLCVSSQVGCAQGCRFCLTARGGFIRNLGVSEIISQVRDVRQSLIRRDMDPLRLSNLVFMGMGEPLANYRNVVDSLEILTDTDFGLKFSPRHVTVSTAGLAPGIRQLGLDTRVNLAVSLNATTDEMRTRLMPVNRAYPLGQLLAACRDFSMRPREKITFEYVLIRDLNDSGQDALRLVRLLSGLRAKINLIPFNEHDRSDFRRPDHRSVSEFLQVLLDKNFTAIVRKSKGADILAACGQLRAKLLMES